MRRSHAWLMLLVLCGPMVADAEPTARSSVQTDSQHTFPGTSWNRISSLQAAGWSGEKLAAAQKYATGDSIHTSAVMVIQGGEVVDQWGQQGPGGIRAFAETDSGCTNRRLLCAGARTR